MPLGLSYNPGYRNKLISIPNDVELIEIGLEHFNAEHIFLFEGKKLSLHISRSPITENSEEQDKFINYLFEKFNGEDTSGIISIGIHLIGKRNSGIGKYGFSSHFDGSKSQVKNAINFILKLQDKLQIPIWLENANFYSNGLSNILTSWHATHEIVELTDSSLIVDLAHVAIDLSNNSINPHGFLNNILWERVAEIHLSGIISGRDECYHDGHSQAVSPIVWDLFSHVSDWYVKSNDVYCTIEHSDECWAHKQDIFYSDIDKVSSFLQEKKIKNYSKKADNYAFNFLKKIIKQRHPKLIQYITNNGIEFDLLASQWIRNRFESDNVRFLLSKEENIDPQTNIKVIDEDFVNYIREVICS